jgi:hypothetical protein
MVRLVAGVAILLSVTSAEADPRRGKPGAPLALELVERAVPGGREVTLVAVARRDVPSIELALGGKTIAFGASATGQRRELTVFVPGDGDVSASARSGSHRMSRVLRGGAPAERSDALRTMIPAASVGRPVLGSSPGAPTAARVVPVRATLRTLPDGRVVKEVRP